MIEGPSRRVRLACLVIAALSLRMDLLGTPFVEYFSNRQVQNAVPIRLLQEGRFTLRTLPTDFTDTYGIAEFQLLPILAIGAYDVLQGFGAAHLPAPGDSAAAGRYYQQIATIGRCISLLMCLATMLLLYDLLRAGWSTRAAELTLLCFALLPLNRFFDQLFIAEPFLMALSTLGLWALWRWSRSEMGWWGFFAVAAPAFALLLLLKVSHVWIGLPIAYLLLSRQGWRAALRWQSWLFAVVVLGPAFYFYKIRGSWVAGGLDQMAVDDTVKLFTDWSFTGPMLEGFLARHVWTVWTPLGTLLCATGLAVSMRARNPDGRRLSGLLATWAAGWVYYWFMAGPMSGHLYYQEPSAPVTAAYMGIATASIAERCSKTIGVSLLAGLVVWFVVFEQVIQGVNDEGSRYWRGGWCQSLLEAGLAVDRRLPPDAKVVSGCRSAIQYMTFYYMHRDGWTLPVEDGDLPQDQAPAKLEELRSSGAQYYVAAFDYDGVRYNNVVFDRPIFDQLPIARYLFTHYRVVEQAGSHIVFDLRHAPVPQEGLRASAPGRP